MCNSDHHYLLVVIDIQESYKIMKVFSKIIYKFDCHVSKINIVKISKALIRFCPKGPSIYDWRELKTLMFHLSNTIIIK
jgi:TFIIF-interacting CTD phosphatase-like protein